MRPQPRYQPGDKIGGCYQVHQALMGGMGEVYLCLDLETIQPYALKTFQQRYLTNPKVRELFKEEVATWVALEKHPNIVRCFYMDIIDNQPFMFLEWIAGDESRGTDLRSWLRHEPLDLRLALDFTIDICRGLIHAGQKQPGIVHRDLKPENILVAQGRLAKITDWGLAKIVQEAKLEISGEEPEAGERHSLVGAGGIVGTPAYMAPEQWLGEELDARTDIYAVGCILYEMLTGRRLFEATTVDGLCHQHLEVAIPTVTDGDSLPTALEALLARCLAKQRDERFAAVNELLREVSEIYQQQFAEVPRSAATSGEFTAIDHTNRGVTYARLQRYDDALQDYSYAIQLDPTYARAFANRGATYYELQDYNEALADFVWAIEQDPTFAGAYYNRGVTYEELQRYGEALADYTQAIELDPTNAKTYTNRGAIYEGLERYDEALADYDRAIQLDPTASLAYTNRGNVYYKLQRYDEALADYTEAVQVDHTDAMAYFGRGLTYARRQRYEESLAEYTRAVELDPALAQAYTNRGNIYEQLAQYDEAIADHTRAIQQDPTLAQAHNNRGNVHVMQQRFEEALTDLTRAIELDPTDAQAHNNRGTTYAQLHRYEEAMADYSRAIQLEPAYSDPYLNMGVVLARRGSLEEALPYLDKAEKLGDPQGAQYAAQLRQMLNG
ncbi:MAG: tetratricopeptide repeat protein [Anaerolineae bacterium]